jgi:phosphoribosyl 1,2-cyclic phosphate phosphodiesterase
MALLRFIILGCGSSGGVPRIGGVWGDCDPANPKNQRTRCSLLIERHENGGVTRVLIDTSPDMRAQLIREGVSGVDAVFYTHSHGAGLGRRRHAERADLALRLCLRSARRLLLPADL